jgi:hypothetical protein
MVLENKYIYIRKEKNDELTLLPMARWPGGPLHAGVLLPLPLCFGPSRTEQPFPLSRIRMGWPRAAVAAFSPPLFADAGARMSAVSLTSSS